MAGSRRRREPAIADRTVSASIDNWALWSLDFPAMSGRPQTPKRLRPGGARSTRRLTASRSVACTRSVGPTISRSFTGGVLRFGNDDQGRGTCRSRSSVEGAPPALRDAGYSRRPGNAPVRRGDRTHSSSSCAPPFTAAALGRERLRPPDGRLGNGRVEVWSTVVPGDKAIRLWSTLASLAPTGWWPVVLGSKEQEGRLAEAAKSCPMAPADILAGAGRSRS